MALCCAIDAEWPPEETTQEGRSGGPPHATLVQLALVLVPGTALPAAARTAASGGASARSSTSCCVLLLDLLRLPQAAVKQALQALFRCAWMGACRQQRRHPPLPRCRPAPPRSARSLRLFWLPAHPLVGPGAASSWGGGWCTTCGP